MKVFLDACVLFPSVVRETLVGAAGEGLFTPQWSGRVLEEWALAARRRGVEDVARVEIALLGLAWPNAAFTPKKRDMDRLVLPDENDVHVLAAAIAGSADILITLNAKDFPRHTLNEEGLSRQDPDGFLHALWREDPAALGRVTQTVFQNALKMENPPQSPSSLLKKAGLYRLAKALRD